MCREAWEQLASLPAACDDFIIFNLPMWKWVYNGNSSCWPLSTHPELLAHTTLPLWRALAYVQVLAFEKHCMRGTKTNPASSAWSAQRMN